MQQYSRSVAGMFIEVDSSKNDATGTTTTTTTGPRRQRVVDKIRLYIGPGMRCVRSNGGKNLRRVIYVARDIGGHFARSYDQIGLQYAANLRAVESMRSA